jgi:radical SAM protein with 4Fe4S-binding SPASM domain
LCDGTRTREEIIHEFSELSGEPVKEIENDFDAFVNYLVEKGALQWVEEQSYIEPIYQGTRPLSLTIALTFDCNLSCSFCSVKGGSPLNNELTTDDIIPLIEQVKKHKPTPFRLSGGEPLLRKEIVLSILEEVCPIKEMSVSVLTNGTLVTEDYAQQLYDAGLRLARVGVDGHTSAVHDALRGRGSFEKAVRGIKHLQDVGIHVNAAALICHTNYPYLEDIRLFLKEIGDSYVINPLYPIGRAKGSDLLLEPEEGLQVRLDRIESGRIQTIFTPRDTCIIGMPLYVQPDGDVFPCFYLQIPEFRLGNIRDDSLEDIYKTDLMQQLLDITIKDIKGCTECDLRYFCGGGCRGSAYREAGSLYVPDPLDCDVYKTMALKIFDHGGKDTKRTLEHMVEATRASNTRE